MNPTTQNRAHKIAGRFSVRSVSTRYLSTSTAGEAPSGRPAIRSGFRTLAWLLSLALVITLAAAPQSAWAALQGYWDFDEGAGTSAFDPVNGNDGTLLGSSPGLPTWTGGHTGLGSDSALDFAGGAGTDQSTGPRVFIPNSASLMHPESQTISMWLRARASGPGPVVGYDRQQPWNKAYGGSGTWTLEPGGSINYYYGNSGGNANDYQARGTGGGYVPADTWVHVISVRNTTDDNFTWYKNGVGNTPLDLLYNPAVAGTNPVYIGSGYTNSFDGLIDDVAVWNEALSDAEIRSLYYLSTDPDQALLSRSYDVQDLDTLWKAYAQGPTGTALIHGEDFWYYTDNIDISGRSLGDSWLSGTDYFLLLDVGTTSGLIFNTVPIPEPSTLTLFLFGFVGLLTRRRRRSAENSAAGSHTNQGDQTGSDIGSETTRIANFTMSLAALLVAISFTTAAHAVSLKVDIGQSVSGTVTPESGYNAFLDNGTDMYTADFGTGGGGSDMVTVSVTAPFYRSTGTSTAAYVQVTSQPGFNDLLSGAALVNNVSQSISLVLSDLEEGDYMIRTYHHSNYTSNAGLGELDIYLTDSLVTNQLVHDDVPVTIGATPGSFTIRDTMFYGTSATLLFDGVGGTNGSNHANLNGFELTFIPPLIPEPSTAAMLALAPLGIACHSRRRRRRR